MFKYLVFILSIGFATVAFSQGNLAHPKPYREVEKVERLPKHIMCPFWGHIQQYKVAPNTIIITFPDQHAEKYVDKMRVERIQCNLNNGVYYLEETKKLKCSYAGFNMKNEPIDGHYSISIAFKKADVVEHVERMYARYPITLDPILNGFKMSMKWDDNNILVFEHHFINPSLKWIYIETIIYDYYRKYRKAKENEKFYYLNLKVEHSKMPFTFKVAEVNEVKPTNYCEEYAYNFIKAEKELCPYFIMMHQEKQNIKELIKHKKPYYYLNVVYDYELPHD